MKLPITIVRATSGAPSTAGSNLRLDPLIEPSRQPVGAPTCAS
jgi:hypothetical protein